MILYIVTKDNYMNRSYCSVVATLSGRDEAISMHKKNFTNPTGKNTPKEYLETQVTEINKKQSMELQKTVPLIYNEEADRLYKFGFYNTTKSSQLNNDCKDEPRFRRGLERFSGTVRT